MSAQNEGLKLIKPAEKVLTLTDLPSNWRDHIEVVTRRRAKIRVSSELKDENLDPFEALTSARKMVPLDQSHKDLMDDLIHSGYSTIWVPDHHLLQTHTCALAEMQKEKKLEGIFKTTSPGNNKQTPNCFMFPLEKGAWKVFRFSPGTSEDETWTQDKEGWTTCFFNCKPNLATAAKAVGGQEDPDKPGYIFDNLAQAEKAAEILGQKIEFPTTREGNDPRTILANRKTRLKAHKDGRLVIEIEKRPNEKDKTLQGWISKKDKFVKMFDVLTETEDDSASHGEYDSIIRQLVSPSNNDAGWYLRGDDKSWQCFSTEKVKLRLIALGLEKPQVEMILGNTIGKTWKLVNVPFQSEYPGDRQWNVDAAQHFYKPANLDYDQVPVHPHWDRILQHCGQDLDGAVRKDEWCKLHNIKSGSDYLLHWIAFLLRDPFMPLPYLFLYGNQNSGKSILHQAIRLLVTKGVASADRALGSTTDFNGELANCVLAYIEETDLSKVGSKGYSRIKDWTTNDELWIRRMRTDAYKQRNTLHFIQTGNHLSNIYLEPKDTRIVVLFVPDLEPGEEIPRDTLIAKLKEEGEHFMRTIIDLTLPAPFSRMGLPPLRNPNKERAERLNTSCLDAFIDENCHRVVGETVDFVSFYKRFIDWLPENQRNDWRKGKVIDDIKQRFPYGALSNHVRAIGNLSFDISEPQLDDVPWVVVGDKLVKQ
jgi:hypothetical protein